MLLICSASVVLHSAGSGVKSVVVVLDALRVSWFLLDLLCISWPRNTVFR